MKKKALLILGVSTVMGLAACGGNQGDVTSSNTKDTDASQKTSETSASTLPSTVEEILANVQATSYCGFDFEEKGDAKANGRVLFSENDLWVSGKATFEEEGVVNMMIYQGKRGNDFFDIENYVGVHARKKHIVAEVTDSNTQIAESAWKEKLFEPRYNANWFQDSLTSLFEHNPSLSVKEAGTEYTATLSSYLGGTSILEGTLRFETATNAFLGGTLTQNKWGEDNFDAEKKTPIDTDQRPEQSSVKIAELLSEKPSGAEFDPAPYFVSSIDEFYVSSYSDYRANNLKAEAGSYVNLHLEKVSPATAINDRDIKIIATSDPEVISVDSFTGSVKALKPGSAKLTISDPLGEITKEVTVTVTSPALTALYLYADQSILKPGDTSNLRVEFYPEASLEAFEAVSSAPDVVQVISIAADRKSVQIKALKAGTAEIALHSVANPSIKTSKAVKITVKEPAPEVDTSWIVGKWSYSSSSYDVTFTFNKDKTGDVLLVIDDDLENKATFNWTYDGVAIAFSNWKYPSSGYVDTIKSIALEANATSFNATLTFDDADGYDSTLTRTLTKEKEDVSWLVGTWKPEDENFPCFVFNADGTGKFKASFYGGEYGFTWTYAAGVLSFPKEGWKDQSETIKTVKSASASGITVQIDDGEEVYIATVVKQA